MKVGQKVCRDLSCRSRLLGGNTPRSANKSPDISSGRVPSVTARQENTTPYSCRLVRSTPPEMSLFRTVKGLGKNTDVCWARRSLIEKKAHALTQAQSIEVDKLSHIYTISSRRFSTSTLQVITDVNDVLLAYSCTS